MDRDASLRHHVTALLTSRHAHLPFDAAVARIAVDRRGVAPRSSAHTPWQLLEHLRIAQWDIVAFSRDGEHVSPEFPDGYWPTAATPPDPEAWDRSAAAFRSDLGTMCALVNDPALDLLEPFPWGDGQTLLREALLLADHNAYHVGQLALAGG